MTDGITRLNERWIKLDQERPYATNLIPGSIIFEALALLAKSKNLEEATTFIRLSSLCGKDAAVEYFQELGKAYLGIA